MVLRRLIGPFGLYSFHRELIRVGDLAIRPGCIKIFRLLNEPCALRSTHSFGLGVVFFNMARPDATAAAGEPDGLSWHGGAAVTGDGTGEDGGAGGKWTLQAFLELPEDLKGAGNKARLKAALDAVG